MKRNPSIFLSIAFFAVAIVSSCNSLDDGNGVSRTVISASFDDVQSKVAMWEKEGDLSLFSRWQDSDRFDVFIGNRIVAEKQPVLEISDDGATCSFALDLSESSYPSLNGLLCTTSNAFAGIVDGKLFCNASLVRAPLADYSPPLYGEPKVSDRRYASVHFHHYLTYEVVHIKNISSAAIDFSLCGYQSDKIWYKEKGGVSPVSPDLFAVDSPVARDPVNKSEPVRIMPQEIGVVISAYVPTGYKVSNAVMVAEINGDSVKSINAKSSDIELKTGRVYHIRAEWDGKELKLASKVPNGDIFSGGSGYGADEGGDVSGGGSGYGADEGGDVSGGGSGYEEDEGGDVSGGGSGYEDSGAGGVTGTGSGYGS